MESKYLKKQVCSIEQSKKLKELGFIQQSLFMQSGDEIYKDKKGKNWLRNSLILPYSEIEGLYFIENLIKQEKTRFYSAYTQTELLAFLPYGIGFQDNNITQIADYLIELIVVEEFLVEEYNERYREFFEIDLTEPEL